MFQHKLNEIEKQIIEKEVEDDKVDEEDKEREKERERENEREKVLSKKTPLVLNLSYLNKSIPVISVNE